MSISTKTQKILWARSGNRCAYCKALLVLHKTEQHDETVIGDEAHIVAERFKGPRGRSNMAVEDRNRPENLILLCKVHHKLIDDHPEIYTVEVLTKLKEDHENWVAKTLDPNLKSSRNFQSATLSLLSDAKIIVEIVASASSLHTDYPAPLDKHELSLIEDLLGEFEGITILSSEPLYIAQAMLSVAKALTALESSGFCVYGGITKGTLALNNGQTIPWKHGFIVLKKFRVPSITVEYDPSFQV